MIEERFGRGPVPQAGRLSHIAFIMDGNGRWATRRGLPRPHGHRAGVERLSEVARTCFEEGISTVTVYAFSSENWKRPKEEVDEILHLVSLYVDRIYCTREREGVHVRFIGDLTPLDPDLRARIARLDTATAHHPQTLNIALNYGGRQELVRAVNAAIREGVTSLTEEEISRRLYTATDPDLVVRTGGEYRTSNFLLWQSAYAEYAFTDTLWPDFGRQELLAVLEEYSKRHRRFGGL